MAETKPFYNVGVVRNAQGEALIVKRQNEDHVGGPLHVVWTFPSGRKTNGHTPAEIEQRQPEIERAQNVEAGILAETGYRIKADRQISLRVHPDFGEVTSYHLCHLEEEQQVPVFTKPERILEIKWVKPEELKNYFTTNFDLNIQRELGLIV